MSVENRMVSYEMSKKLSTPDTEHDVIKELIPGEQYTSIIDASLPTNFYVYYKSYLAEFKVLTISRADFIWVNFNVCFR